MMFSSLMAESEESNYFTITPWSPTALEGQFQITNSTFSHMALVASSHTDYVGVCWGFDMFICDGELDFVCAAQSIKNYFLPKE